MRRVIILALVAGFLCAGTQAFGQTAVDPKIQAAIEKGVNYLLSKQKPDGSWGPFGKVGDHNGHLTGPTALVTLALMESGKSPQDPAVEKALNWLAAQKETKTYSLGLRANVWAAANRTTDDKYAKFLDRDVKQLIASSPTGAISYDATGQPHRGGWDNSNCQYHLLGIWAGIMGQSEEVNAAYIKRVMGHWMGCQQRDGGWSYSATGASTPTMTVAGLASMFVCFDYLSTASTTFNTCNRGTGQPKPIAAGMAKLEAIFPGTISSHGYYMYGVERVALASGYKYFGKSDWFKMGSNVIVNKQGGDGGWEPEHGNREVGTAFCLLFLIRGKNAVLFNKLEYEGDWSNRPRDLANLTRWMSTKVFENTVNWQIINLNTPVAEWHDAPILYIAGSIAPTIKPEQAAKIKEFINQGGTVLSCGECAGQAFAKAIPTLTKELFPDYKLEPVPANHPLYTKETHYTISDARPKFSVMTNGSRPLWIHTDMDLPIFWQGYKVASQRWAFESMINLTIFVANSPKTLRSRGTTHWPNPPAEAPAKTVKVARLQYEGNFDPEPLALERLSRLAGQRDKVKVEVAVTPIAKLDPAAAKVAFLTGTTAFKPSADQTAAMKKFVEGGGTLVVDACGGSRDFGQAAETWIEDAFGARTLRTLASTSPVYKDIERAKYRDRTRRRLGAPKTCNLRAVLVGDRAGVLYSAEDITTALLGTECWTADGYMGETAEAICRNILAEAAK